MNEEEARSCFRRTAISTEIPDALIFDPTLTAEEKIILMILYTAPSGKHSKTFLSDASGVSVNDIGPILQKLKKSGLFSIEEDKSNGPSLSRINFEDRYHHLPVGDHKYSAYSSLFYTKRFYIFKELMLEFETEILEGDVK
jgi:hypothetical protein